MSSSLDVPAQRATGDVISIWAQLEQLTSAVNPIDLSIGCPNFQAPEFIRKHMQAVVDGPGWTQHQYTQGFGHPPLRAILAHMYAELLGRKSIDAGSEVVITNGAMEGLFISIMGLINPGDEVVLIEPYFDSYIHQVKIAGGVPKFVPLRQTARGDGSQQWSLDYQELRAAFSPKTKIIIVNSPHNPTGKVFSRDDLEAVRDLCSQYGVCCVSDEVYEWITYGHQHIRIATLPGMWDRTITIGSAGKTFAVTGWKLGWMIGPSDLLSGPRVVHQNSGYICNTPLQESLARAFQSELPLLKAKSADSYLLSVAPSCRNKRDMLVGALLEAGLVPIVPEGGYFLLVDIKEAADEIGLTSSGDSQGPKDVKFVKWMILEKKLAAIPPSIFYSDEHKHLGENYIRLCFMKDDATLSAAVRALRQLRAH